MADVTISGLNNRQPGSSALFPYSEGGTTYQATLNQIIPTGVIMMWSGSIASVPSGWALCNGLNGTPNLQDRFIVGAGSSYNPNDTGGVASVTLTTAQMPAHSHNVSSRTYSSGGGGQGPWPFVGGPATTGGSISMNTAGEDQPHENRPPYYALAYIIKL